MNGILWVLRTGAPWADLPEAYPQFQTCHRRFQQWVRSGVMKGILEALALDLKLRGVIDSNRRARQTEEAKHKTTLFEAIPSALENRKIICLVAEFSAPGRAV